MRPNDVFFALHALLISAVELRLPSASGWVLVDSPPAELLRRLLDLRQLVLHLVDHLRPPTARARHARVRDVRV